MRDLDLNREVGRWVDLKIDVVRVRNPFQIPKVEALIRLKALIQIFTAPGGGSRGHHRDAELPGEDSHELAEERFFSFVFQ